MSNSLRPLAEERSAKETMVMCVCLSFFLSFFFSVLLLSCLSWRQTINYFDSDVNSGENPNGVEFIFLLHAFLSVAGELRKAD